MFKRVCGRRRYVRRKSGRGPGCSTKVALWRGRSALSTRCADVHPTLAHYDKPLFIFVAGANSAPRLAYCPSPQRKGRWQTDP